MPATTVNAAISSTSMCSVVSGMANAAASVTTPRIPAQPSRNVAAHDGEWSSGPRRRTSRARAPNTHTSRSTITAARVARQQR